MAKGIISFTLWQDWNVFMVVTNIRTVNWKSDFIIIFFTYTRQSWTRERLDDQGQHVLIFRQIR